MERMRHFINAVASVWPVPVLLGFGYLAGAYGHIFWVFVALLPLGLLLGHRVGGFLARVRHEGWREGVDSILECMPLGERMQLLDRLEEELDARQNRQSD